jgi:hypothetical protein
MAITTFSVWVNERWNSFGMESPNSIASDQVAIDPNIKLASTVAKVTEIFPLSTLISDRDPMTRAVESIAQSLDRIVEKSNKYKFV